MAHCDARAGKWRGNWRMEWEVSTLHTTSEYGVSSITIANAYTSATNSRPNWRPCRFKWTRQFRRKTKSGFCAFAITFQTQSTIFFDITTQTAWSSGGKKKLVNTKYVFLFSLQLLSYTILILRIILGNMIINVHTSSCIARRYFGQILMKREELTRQIFEKCSNIRFNKNPSGGRRDVTCGRTAGSDEARNGRF
jgi:hypothetical protein